MYVRLITTDGSPLSDHPEIVSNFKTLFGAGPGAEVSEETDEVVEITIPPYGHRDNHVRDAHNIFGAAYYDRPIDLVLLPD